jgi:hypothetical protein
MIMAVRETAKQRRQRLAGLLAEYREKADLKSKLDRDVDTLKRRIRDEIPGPATFGEWVREHGGTREITDMDKVRADYARHGEQVPTKTTDPSIIVRHVSATK